VENTSLRGFRIWKDQMRQLRTAQPRHNALLGWIGWLALIAVLAIGLRFGGNWSSGGQGVLWLIGLPSLAIGWIGASHRKAPAEGVTAINRWHQQGMPRAQQAAPRSQPPLPTQTPPSSPRPAGSPRPHSLPR
jgi:hypothetical protein